MFWHYYFISGFLFLVIFAEDITTIIKYGKGRDAQAHLAYYFAQKYGDNQTPQLFLAFLLMLFIPHIIIASIAFDIFGKK